MEKYTTEQVVRGIEHFTSHYLDEPFRLELDLPLHKKHWEPLAAQEICPLEFLEELAEYFGFRFAQDRVLGWLKLREGKETRRCQRNQAPETKRTGRDLVELIIRHAECPSFAAKSIFGVRCEKAGCFLGIASLAKTPRRIAPSTRIRDVMSSFHYRDLTEKLAWITGCRQLGVAIRPSRNWVDGLSKVMVVLLVMFSFGIGLMLAISLHPALGIVAALVLLVCSLLIWGLTEERLKRAFIDEVAPGIQTFRDLAEVMVELTA